MILKYPAYETEAQAQPQVTDRSTGHEQRIGWGPPFGWALVVDRSRLNGTWKGHDGTSLKELLLAVNEGLLLIPIKN